MFICATAGVREILNKGPLKVCFATNTFSPPLRLCIQFADANNGLSPAKNSEFEQQNFGAALLELLGLWRALRRPHVYESYYKKLSCIHNAIPTVVCLSRWLHIVSTFLTALNSLLDSSVLKTCQVMIDKLFHVFLWPLQSEPKHIYLIRWHYGKPSTRIWRQRCWHRAAFYTHDRQVAGRSHSFHHFALRLGGASHIGLSNIFGQATVYAAQTADFNIYLFNTRTYRSILVTRTYRGGGQILPPPSDLSHLACDPR